MVVVAELDMGAVAVDHADDFVPIRGEVAKLLAESSQPFGLEVGVGGAQATRSLQVEKRIRYEQAIVVLAVIEVLAEDFGTAGGFGGSQDGSIPIGDLETFFDGKRSLKCRDRVFLDAETEPLLNQASGNVVGQCVGASGVGCLNVKLLEYLHGEDKIGAGQDLIGEQSLGGLHRLEIKRIEQDVGIKETHDGCEVLRG